MLLLNVLMLYNELSCISFPFLFFINRANDEKQTGGSLSLDKKRSDFITAQSRLQDQIIESIQTHCDEFIEDLKDPEELAPSQQNQQPHPSVSNMITYLRVTFELIAFLPRSFYEVCQFTTCRHIGQYFQQLLTESDVMNRIIEIIDIGEYKCNWHF